MRREPSSIITSRWTPVTPFFFCPYVITKPLYSSVHHGFRSHVVRVTHCRSYRRRLFNFAFTLALLLMKKVTKTQIEWAKPSEETFLLNLLQTDICYDSIHIIVCNWYTNIYWRNIYSILSRNFEANASEFVNKLNI